MKKLSNKEYIHLTDIKRILYVLLKNDYFATPEEIFVAWHRYSDDTFAGWLRLPDDEYEIIKIIKLYIN